MPPSSLLGLVSASLVILSLSCCWTTAFAQCSSSELTVTLPDGSGVVIGDSAAAAFTPCVDFWLGIPFVQPPVGTLRWQPPARITQPWRTPLQAWTAGPMCPQASGGEEDCLYLNIYAPANRSPSQPLPVVVWIYGGSWLTGDSDHHGLYNGTNWQGNQDPTPTLLVSFNYRLGALGFLTLDALAVPGQNDTVGNYGLRDQVEALEWVQRNIAAFGGDPTRVTIMGESAGAFSILAHLTDPAVYDRTPALFHRAIVQSGAPIQFQYFQPLLSLEAYSSTFAEQELGCPIAPPEALKFCLLNLTLAEIMNANLPPHFAVAAVQPLYAIATGQWAQVPVLFGTNLNESASLLDLPNLAATFQLRFPDAGTSNPFVWADVPIVIQMLLFELIMGPAPFSTSVQVQLTEQLLQEYLPSDFGSPLDLIGKASTDTMFYCSSIALGDVLVNQNVPVWGYKFAYNASDFSGYNQYGDYHGLDLPYVFDRLIIFSHDDFIFSDHIESYWSNFIAAGDPNPPRASTHRHHRAKAASLFPWPSMTSLSEGSEQLLLRTVDVNETFVEPFVGRCKFMLDVFQQWNAELSFAG
jgi:para-nitrobenzyl esterase